MKVLTMNQNNNNSFVIPSDMYLVIPHAHETGGVERSRDVIDDRAIGAAGRKTEARTIQIVADEIELKGAKQICNRAKAVIMRHLQYTEIGYLCSGKDLAALDHDLAAVMVDANAHNSTARHTQARIVVYRTKLDPQIGTAEIAAIAARVCEAVIEIRSAVQSGDLAAYRNAVQKNPNLPGLCAGVIRGAVETALSEADHGMEQIRNNANAIRAAERRGSAPVAALDPATLPTGALDTAIELLS